MGNGDSQAFSDQSRTAVTSIESLWAEAEIPAAYLDLLRLGITPPSTTTAASENVSPLLAIRRLPGLCCAGMGRAEQEAQCITAAWQLLYVAAHVLDDLEDGDSQFAPLVAWGAGPIFNASTGWIVSAYYLLNKLETTGIDSKVAQTIRSDFCHTILHMCAGQHIDLTTSEPTLQQCWQTIAWKSASFFALACRAGARIASQDLQQIELMGQCGHHIGILIQLGDDWGDLESTPGTRSDVANLKWSLPIAYAMTVLGTSEAARLQGSLQLAAHDEDAAIEARRLIIQSGALFYLAVEAERHRQEARTILETTMQPSPARQELFALLNSLASLHTT